MLQTRPDGLLASEFSEALYCEEMRIYVSAGQERTLGARLVSAIKKKTRSLLRVCLLSLTVVEGHGLESQMPGLPLN